MIKYATCRNPRCREEVPYLLRTRPVLCASCRFAGQVGMFVGGLIVGAIAWWVR